MSALDLARAIIAPPKPKRAYAQLGADPELTERITALVAFGASLPIACAAAGVHLGTVRYWIRQGRRGRAPYAAFWRALCAAKEQCAADCRAALERGNHADH